MQMPQRCRTGMVWGPSYQMIIMCGQPGLRSPSRTCNSGGTRTLGPDTQRREEKLRPLPVPLAYQGTSQMRTLPLRGPRASH